MRSLMQLSILGIFAISSVAHAGIYVGAGTGDGSVEEKVQGIPFDAEDSGFRAFLGFRKARFFGLEGGYFDLGDADDQLGGNSLAVELTGWDLSGVVFLPLTRRLELFGRAGVAYWESDSAFSDGIIVSREENDGTDFTYGIGLGYRLGKRFSIRGEREYFEVDGTEEVDLTTLGVEIRF